MLAYVCNPAFVCKRVFFFCKQNFLQTWQLTQLRAVGIAFAKQRTCKRVFFVCKQNKRICKLVNIDHPPFFAFAKRHVCRRVVSQMHALTGLLACMCKKSEFANVSFFMSCLQTRFCFLQTRRIVHFLYLRIKRICKMTKPIIT